jgi:hypothetical protein
MEEGGFAKYVCLLSKHEVAKTFSYAAHNEAYKIHTIHNRTSPTVAFSRPQVSFIGPCLFKDAVCKSENVASSGRFMSE